MKMLSRVPIWACEARWLLLCRPLLASGSKELLDTICSLGLCSMARRAVVAELVDAQR